MKYGDNYHIQLAGVTPPITLEFRHIAIEANQTNRYLVRIGYRVEISFMCI